MTRALLALAAAAATLAAAWAAAPRLATLASVATLVRPDDPTVVRDREVTSEFGFENPVVWVMEARAGTMWTRPMLQRLAALTDDVRRIPGVVALDVIGLASPNMRDLRVTEEGLEPTYLMGEVPTTPDAIAALRRRIDGDPNYAGTLVTRDGRAAMVVANFRTDADQRSVGVAALDLRDRYRDAETAVWAVGAPVLGVLAPTAFAGVAFRGATYALAAVVILCLVLGVRAAVCAVVAALLAVAWTTAGVALGRDTLPWALEAAVPTALLATAIAVGAGRPWMTAAVTAVSMLPGAIMASPPARTLWLAAAASCPIALAAGELARIIFRPALGPFHRGRVAWTLAVASAAAAVLGAPRLRCSLAPMGYAPRYLPSAATADVAALGRLFPPPLSLAVRARGEPGFVTEPAVLRALDAGAAAARADPSVRSAMSIADVVKMVHRAFNDERPEYFAIPDDRALVGRYLALAYSPAFRRFLDRAFAETALWVQVDGERPGDVKRVLSRVRTTLEGHPVPGMNVDLPAGDGAVLLVMATLARQIAMLAVLGLLVAAAVAAGFDGWRAAARTLAAGSVAGAVGAGVLGSGGQAVDLVSLPVLTGAALATGALAGPAAAPVRLGLGLAGVGAVAVAAPLPAAPLVAALLLGPGLGLILCAAGDTSPVRGARPVRATELRASESCAQCGPTNAPTAPEPERRRRSDNCR